ncbi:hypothetical protein O181_067454 [Austropuccinia psidii MF-1]|uniref:Peptidase A2 domain-containing protein n=1 Tax=Austropuccinia psidii MF-1 TaxID=1389203 RepID=A0A9Q3I6J7_9BASI|nr:hypothetical protein [Austropuccinia psidii MF-1]
MSASEQVKEKIEATQGYEEKNWKKLKEELTTEWGRVEPDRRYRPESLEKLFNNTKRAGGIRNLAEYKRFIGEYEKITNYLFKYGYIRREIEHNEELYASLSTEIRTSIIKEMRRDKVMIQARDGGYIVPEMKVLKSYIEQELETVIISRDRAEDTTSHYGLNQPHIDNTQAKKVQFEDDTMENALKQLKELNNKIKEQQRPRIQDQEEKKEIKDFIKQIKEITEAVLPQSKTGQVLKQENQSRYPKDNLPPFSQRHIPYTPAQNIPKPYLKCYYCLEEGHSVNRCNYLFDDQNKKWVSRQGGGFLFPNWQRVPTDGKISPKKLVEDFAKEQEELIKKRKENEAKESTHQPKEVNIIQAKKNDIATAIAKIEDWGSWQPPTISSANDPFLNNYGLRNTKQRSSRNEKPSQEPTKSSPKTMETPLKKKPHIPGAYIEDEHGTVEKTIIPTKFKKPQEIKGEEEVSPEVKEKQDSGKKLELTQNTVKNKNIKQEHTEFQEVMSQIIKKVLDQKINLTLEQVLIMSPKVINQLKNLTTEERNSINSLDTKEIQTKLINHHLGDYEQPKLHYACPLGFMQVYLGEEGHEIMALVDTGSELNIIPEDSAIKAGLTTRCLNMNLRGIGGHCTSIVGLAEFTPITLVTGEERNIHLFVARGAVHTLLGRPFLADNNIRLDFSQQKGEIFSYIEPDGRRLCLPICSPQKVGWRENPPAGMETCAVSKLEDWKELPVEKEPSSNNQGI